MPACDPILLKRLLNDQLGILDSAAQVLRESHQRVKGFIGSARQLSSEEKESCEALTARFARLCDFLFQRAFRTLDQVELMDEGTGIDRLNRMEKRGVIPSALKWRELRELRNEIADEYLIEGSDRVLKDAFLGTSELFETQNEYKNYCDLKGYLN